MRKYLLLTILLIVSPWKGISLPMEITDNIETLFFDGITPTEVPRVDVATGKLLEVLVRIDEASSQGVMVTDTHVYIPFRSLVRAQFATSNSITGEYQAGILNQFNGKQEERRYGVDPVTLTSEKWHVLHYEGPWNQVTPSPPVRAKAVDDVAREMATTRHATVLAQGAASELGMRSGKAFQRVNVMNDIFDYAVNSSDHLETHQADIDVLRQKLEMSNIPERRHTPSNNVQTLRGCHHLESMQGLVSWSDDKEGVWVPLARPIVSLIGLSSNMPARITLSFGTTVYMYDAETDTLEYYANHNALMDLVSQQSLFPATPDIPSIYGPDYLPAALYVSPADGATRPLPPLDENSPNDSVPPTEEAYVLWEALQAMPVDYAYYDQPTEVICPDSVRARVDASLKSFNASVFYDPQVDDATLKAFVQEQYVPLMTQVVGCAKNFNRDGYTSHSPFAFADVSWIAMVHGQMEIEPESRLAFISDAALDDLLIGSERCKKNEKGIRGHKKSGVRCTFKQQARKTENIKKKAKHS